MALPVIPGTYRCAFNWTVADSGLTATNVMHFERADYSAENVYFDIDGAVTADMWLQTKTDIGISSVEVTPLDGTSLPYIGNTGKGVKWSGSQSGGDFIPQVATIVKLTTAKRGRSYRGRVFLPFVGETRAGGGIMDPTTRSDMEDAWVAFVSAMATAGTPMAIASYKLATSEDVIQATVESFCGTIRKRQPR